MIRRLALALALAAPLAAVQIQDVSLLSPLGGTRFDAVLVPAEAGADPGPADMGVDIDGCRHASGPSEYDYFIVIDPSTYFAALGSEWDQRSGRFTSDLPAGFKEWLGKEFGSEREIDHDRIFKSAVQVARSTGRQPPERAGFQVPQGSVPIEKRYRIALACYEKRGARNLVLAKIALTGAWALRSRAQIPIANPALDGGVQEVNGRLAKLIEDGERFDLQKFLPIYRKMVDQDGFNREGYTVAGMSLMGFLMRDGDPEAVRQLAAKMSERLGEDDKPDILKGLVRERRRLFEDHQKLLNLATDRFVAAIAAEEVVRPRIPEILLVVAEGLRRTGSGMRAIDWYTALGKLPETQPAVRAELRAQGKNRALPADKPYHVQLGWIADEAIDRLTKAGVVHPGEISGPDRGLLFAVINEGLGTSAYNAPGWKPAADGNQQDCAVMLDLIGKAVLDSAFRLGSWPKSLGELWEREVVRDRNRVNRFHCPATGKPFLYAEPPGDISRIAPSTVLVATPAALATSQGQRFGAFLASGRVVWTEAAPVIGQPLPQP
jgi:hypothetical protein